MRYESVLMEFYYDDYENVVVIPDYRFPYTSKANARTLKKQYDDIGEMSGDVRTPGTRW